MNSNYLPLQAIPEAKKTEQWKRDQVDSVIARSRFGQGSGTTAEVTRLYDFYSGDIDPSEYRYVTDPYDQNKKGAARLRTFPIIKNVVDVLLGEKSKRAFNHSVVIINSDAVTRKNEARKKMLKQAFAELMVAQVAPDVPEAAELQPEEPDIAKLASLFEHSYRDARAIIGQKALNYITFYCRVQDNFLKAFKDFLIAGYCVSYQGVVSDEPYYRILNPARCDWAKDPDEDLLENADWFVYRDLMHLSGVLKRYHKFLTPDQVQRLEEQGQKSALDGPLDRSAHSEVSGTGSHSLFNPQGELFEVYWVSWQSVRKLGVGEVQTPDGPEMIIVDEDWKPDPNNPIEIEWFMVNEVWEGHRIGRDTYVGIEPLLVQRTSMDNLSSPKLPFNGVVYFERNTSRISLVSMGIPYQLLYDIYNFRLERSVARSKDVIAQFDIGMIPKEWSMDKFLYYVEEMGIAWTKTDDASAVNPHLRQYIDMSVKVIDQYLALLAYIKQSWETVAGISSQRQGQVGQYEGKGVMQQALMQSSHITEELFRKFAIYERTTLQALLDYSKVAWINGKKAAYVMPEGAALMFEIDGVGYMEAEMGVFIADSRKEGDKLDAARQMAMAFAQNGAPMTTVLDILDLESFAEIKAKVAEVEAAAAQQQEAEEEARQQALQAELELRAREQARADRQLDIDENEIREINETKIRLAEIAKDDFNEEKRLEVQERLERIRMRLEERKQLEVERNNRAKEDIERIKAKKPATSGKK